MLYSHRSTVLHAMAACMVDAAAMTSARSCCSTVPMFHVNAWGMPYSCTIAGAKQVLPGPYMIGQPVAELIEGERVTSAAGVPTIYNLLYQHLKEKSYDLSSLKTVLIGGAAASRTMMENYQRDFGITILHAWGMTETSPLGTISRLKAAMEDWPEERQLEVRLKQGLPVLGVEIKVVGAEGEELPVGRRTRGRAAGARALDRQQLLQQSRRNRVVHRRWLVPHRRHGDDRPRRLRPDHRPQERPDQAQGRMDLERRHGKRRARASGRGSRPR